MADNQDKFTPLPLEGTSSCLLAEFSEQMLSQETAELSMSYPNMATTMTTPVYQSFHYGGVPNPSSCPLMPIDSTVFSPVNIQTDGNPQVLGNGFHYGVTNVPHQIHTLQSPSFPSRQPYLTIIEQPADRIRYRYKSEKGSHGGLTGKNSTTSKRTYPTVKLECFQRQHNEQVFIKATLYSVDEPKPHVHKLMGKNCKDGICMMELGEDGTASFVNLGILLIGKKEVPDILYQRKVENQLRQSGSTDLADGERAKLREEVEQEAKDMDLNRVRICFEAFSKNLTVSDIFYSICQPKFSNNIANQKCPDVGELKIVRISKCSGVCTGNEEVFLLCEKVNKKDIKIRFYEEDADGRIMWEDYGHFSENDVHHQVAIVFRTPAYKDCNIKEDVRVKLQLYRLKDSQYSESKDFQYTPAYDREEIERKRRKITTHQVHHDLDPSLQSGAGTSGSTWVNTDYQTGFSVSGQSHNLDAPEQHAISSTHFETHYSAPGSLEQTNIFNSDHNMYSYFLHPSSNPMLSNEESEPNPLLEDFQIDSVCNVNPKHPTVKVNLEHAIETLSLDGKDYKQNVGNSITSLKKEDKVKNGNSGSFTSEYANAHKQTLEHSNIQRKMVLANRSLDICAEESLGIEPQTVQIGDSQLASKYVRTKGYELKPNYIQSEGQVKVEHLSFSEQGLDTEQIMFKTRDLERSRSLSNPKDFISLPPEPETKILETSDLEENRFKAIGNCMENKIQSDALPTTLHGVKQLALRMSLALRNFVVTGDLGLLLMTLQHLIAIQDEEGDNALHLTIIHQAKQHIQQLVLIRSLLYIFEELPRQVINDCNNLHQTPLFLAVVTRSHEAIPFLLMSGADANIPDNEGNTPLHVAVRDGNLTALNLLLDRKNYPKGASETIDIDKLNYEGLSPLHVAVINNQEKCVERLCVSEADINAAVGTSGNTSLHLAVEIHPNLVRVLLAQHDIKVDIQNFAGNTALHLACTQGFKDVIISLMEAGANPFVQNFSTTSCLNHCNCEEDNNCYNLKGQMATDLVAGNYELLRILTGKTYEPRQPSTGNMTSLCGNSFPSGDCRRKTKLSNVSCTERQNSGSSIKEDFDQSVKMFDSGYSSGEIKEKNKKLEVICAELDKNNQWKRLGSFLGIKDEMLNFIEKLFECNKSPSKEIIKKFQDQQERSSPGTAEEALETILKLAGLDYVLDRVKGEELKN